MKSDGSPWSVKEVGLLHSQSPYYPCSLFYETHSLLKCCVFGNSFPVCAWTSSTRAPTLINIKEVKYAFYSWERSLFLWFLLPWHLLPTHWVMCAVSSDNTGSQKGRLCEQSTGPEPPHSSGIPFQQACVFTPHPGVRVSGRPLGTPGGWGTES